jgi:hypothetical protein
MSESSDKRKLRHEKWKAKKASDPEFAAKQRELSRAAKKRYEAKKKLTRQSSGPVGSGKPGRIVALCGWSGW